MLSLYAKSVDVRILSVSNFQEKREHFSKQAKRTKAEENVYSKFPP